MSFSKTCLTILAGAAAPVAVRYAYRAYPDGVNVYNAAGLPMVPFRTDNW